jgi:hypothetical protein
MGGTDHDQWLVRGTAAHRGGALRDGGLVQQWLTRCATTLGTDPQETFETQALLCTDLDADPERIISWFVRRWQMESTFQELRQRLRFETQRHWSDKAIERTAPAMLALFSLLTLFANQYMAGSADIARRTAWYGKRAPTFSDVLALVRKKLWAQEVTFCGSLAETETVKVPRDFMERLTDAVCYAA